MRPNIQWTVQVNVRAGQLATAKALADEMSQATKNEEGAVQYEWFFTADGGSCHILEEYRDSAATVIHLNNFLSNYVERFMGCFEPTAVFVYGSPNEEVKEILKAFGPVYMGFVSGFVR